MYLFLGNDTVVSTKNIIGIFDLDNTTVSKFTRNYLKNHQQNNNIIEVSKDLPKSFVVEVINNKINIYLSQISSSTLYKRFNNKNL